ncbi:phospholipase D-like domain-containing protein [Labrys wisconsinensis]|uniref:Phospholipase D n=1 Tax=Labrys wisconsinensis TaxID=425677 RepID=A0ABU0J549_9HYPH|nr:phosphatidylserine/phosphatidylglycerophosphate/cardiolipin synthase family protein [Labrys wisconsinensis]MDQ0468404.1 phosphatidylserine/phosphatidylglycerophosphate/cardiolipin synthase-like enzyme [Labrys wisconsinensis]
MQAGPTPSDQAIPSPAGSYPVRAGNLVRPLVDSGPTFRRIGAAIAAARHSVFVTATFLDPDFVMPDGQGTLFDLLDRAAGRGLDVRGLFWRPNPQSSGYGRTFPGSAEDRALLVRRGSGFSIRWDRAAGPYCQHQKSWLIDAGKPGETAFVGGINPTFAAFEPGHAGENERHDVYVEIAGPCACDVHHNFVQRWNEASERDAADGRWGPNDSDLAFPERPGAPCGTSLVQIQRQIPAGRYGDGHASPGGEPWDIAAGERTVLAQYQLAIAAARRTIYVENQALPVPEIAAALAAALDRGVEVVLLVPTEPEESVRAVRHDPARRAFFAGIEALGQRCNFLLAGLAGRARLAGIAGPNAGGNRCPVYVHDKIMLVDDAWATIGSCNLHGYSLDGHGEMNAAIWDAAVVRALRRTLLAEHLDLDTAGLDDRAALRLFRETASANRARWRAGEAGWQGLAIALDPATYGVERFSG